MKKLKSSIIALSIIIPALLLFAFREDPGILQNILLKMQAFHSKNPQEKLYMHFDKPFYAAGDDVWFKAYLVEASLHNLDSQTRVMYVELIDGSKNMVERKMLHVENGQSFGDFHLSDSIPQGNYLVRAYTNYMKNAGEDFFFMKEITIVNRTANFDPTEKKYDVDSTDLSFFPEGGNLVACGTANRVAFKALAPDGRGIPVEGEILDETNAVVTTFKTQHEGMGLVRLNPTPGKKYRARILKPYQVDRQYELPPVREKGYVMQVDELGKNIKVVVFTNIEKPASGKLDISIVAQSRGKVYHAVAGAITSNAYFTYIPRSKFPDGITQITLFDSEGRPVAERLVHQDQSESIIVSLKTDSTYKRRSQVTVYTDVTYRDNAPATGSFSVSVYDEGLIQNTEKYPLSITNYLTLTSDLKGHIENPGYYFKDNEPATKKNLDLLMMVHGWRRFTWEDVLKGRDMQRYKHEHGIPISGTIKRTISDKAPVGSIVKIMAMRGGAVEARPDSTGRFYSDGLIYYDTMKLVLQTENQKGKKQPYRFILDPFDPIPPLTYSLTDFGSFDASKYLKQTAELNAVNKASDIKLLEAVDIKGLRERDSRTVGSRGDLIDTKKTAGDYTNIFDLIRAKVPGLWIDGTPPNIRIRYRGREPQFFMNGSQYPIEMVSVMTPTDIDGIEVLRNSSALLGSGGIAINLLLKSGAWDRRQTYGVNQVVYPGLHQGREFYSPRYDVPDRRHDYPDKRTSLYWEPMIVTDSTGRIGFSFFTADVASRYRIIMEGITHDGYPGTGTITFKVR